MNQLHRIPPDLLAQVLQDGRAWNMSVEVVIGAKQVDVQKNCFAFMFTNLGNTTAFVNDMVVFPSAGFPNALGDSRSIAAHLLDIYKGNLTVKFGAGATPRLELVQLFYLEKPR